MARRVLAGTTPSRTTLRPEVASAVDELRRHQARWSHSHSERLAECELRAYLERSGRAPDLTPSVAVRPSGSSAGGPGYSAQAAPTPASADVDGADTALAATADVRRRPEHPAASVGVVAHGVFAGAARAALAGATPVPVAVQLARADAALAGVLASAPVTAEEDRGASRRRAAGRGRTAARARLRACVRGIAAAAVLEDLGRCGPEEVYVGADGGPEEFQLDGGATVIRAAPDLAYRHHDATTCPLPLTEPTWVVVELKTGDQPDPARERRQLAVYALWAHQTRGAPLYRGGFLARVVRPRFAVDSWMFLTPEELEDVRRRVADDRRRYDAALAWLSSGLVATAADALPAASDRRVCGRCEVASRCPLRRRSPAVDARVNPEMAMTDAAGVTRTPSTSTAAGPGGDL